MFAQSDVFWLEYFYLLGRHSVERSWILYFGCVASMGPNVRRPNHFHRNAIIHRPVSIYHRLDGTECGHAIDSFDLARIQWPSVLSNIRPCKFDQMKSIGHCSCSLKRTYLISKLPIGQWHHTIDSNLLLDTSFDFVEVLSAGNRLTLRTCYRSDLCDNEYVWKLENPKTCLCNRSLSWTHLTGSWPLMKIFFGFFTTYFGNDTFDTHLSAQW